MGAKMPSLSDQIKPQTITCRQCGSANLVQLRHWNTPPSGKAFDPTHHCNQCGLDFIYRSPKEKLRDFLVP